MTSGSITEYLSATITATKILDYISRLDNTKVTNDSVEEIATLVRALTDRCNAKFLKDFPIDVVYKPTSRIQTNIISWYIHGLDLTNLPHHIISTFENIERNPYPIDTPNRCIDAISILLEYANLIVLTRTGHYLELQEKKTDELQSSNPIETSILVNGDVYG